MCAPPTRGLYGKAPLSTRGQPAKRRVYKIPEVERDGEWLLLHLSSEWVQAPQEVYLRQFRDTPVDDLDALMELCKLGLIRSLNTARGRPTATFRWIRRAVERSAR